MSVRRSQKAFYDQMTQLAANANQALQFFLMGMMYGGRGGPGMPGGGGGLDLGQMAEMVGELARGWQKSRGKKKSDGEDGTF